MSKRRLRTKYHCLKIGTKYHNVLFKTFRWGLYGHLGWGMRWHHAKIGVWTQRGLRVDSRKQQYLKRNGDPRWRRYINALRIQMSYWTTKDGRQGRPMVCGFMFYGGRHIR